MAWAKTSSQQMSCQLQVGDGKRPMGSWSRRVHWTIVCNYTIPYRLTIIWCDLRVNNLEGSQGSQKLQRKFREVFRMTMLTHAFSQRELSKRTAMCHARIEIMILTPVLKQESSKYTMKHKLILEASWWTIHSCHSEYKVPLSLKQLEYEATPN